MLKWGKGKDQNEQGNGGGTVLLVDDEEENLRQMQGLITEDYDVSTATNSDEALELAQQHAFDAIIADQNMPGMTGIGLFIKLQSLNYPAGKILYSGATDLKIVASGSGVKLADALQKPISREALLASIAKAIAGAAA